MGRARATTSTYEAACSVWQAGGGRLDEVVRSLLGCSRRAARCRIAEGRVRVQQRTCRIATKPVRRGQQIELTNLGDQVPHPGPSQPLMSPPWAARPMSSHSTSLQGGTVANILSILYLDRWLVVVSKPSGLLSEANRQGGPYVEQVLAAQLARQGLHTRLWLVHRLDAMTSGVLVLARTAGVAAHLGQQFAQARVKKTYLCLTDVMPEQTSCTVCQPIGRKQGIVHGVLPHGKPAKTRFLVACAQDGWVCLKAQPTTGRTHQIRVHASWAGFPLLGDHLYGGRRFLRGADGKPMLAISRTMLHALSIGFEHPRPLEGANKQVHVVAPLPEDFAAFLSPEQRQ